jgi:hypothetical protein
MASFWVARRSWVMTLHEARLRNMAATAGYAG